MNPFGGKVPEAGDALTSVRHIDHITYAAHHTDEEAFIGTWGKLGFKEHVRVFTIRHPASHIALVSGVSEEYPWATMTGLSISEEEDSAINEMVRRYGAGVQHVAYNIDPREEMDEVHGKLKSYGWNLMTPVLTYEDNNGARLKQIFVAPTIPFGPFVEFIQRLEGENGKAFDGFDQENIDNLYDHYSDYSRSLEKKK
ncbi:hypothetical protein GF324_12395 [bacterium]|nr:hypothetical protein [bacterium]